MWWRHVTPKRQLTFNGLHGIITQKIERLLVSFEKLIEMYSLPKCFNDLIERYLFVNAVSTANLLNCISVCVTNTELTAH
jgi:hypothetical protein